MKKILTLLFLHVFILVVLTSCAYQGYSGSYLDLYTVAINSVPWLNGYSWSADFECDAEIELIDEDNYGRKMFTYREKYYAGGGISFSALIVCQHSNDKEVFYYEDTNYVVKEQDKYSQKLKEFEYQEIENLKLVNDWNKEINYSKCIRKELSKSKSNIPDEVKVKNQIVNEFSLINGKYSMFIDYLTENSSNSNYIMYGHIRKNEQDSIYFIGLVNTENGLFKSLNTLTPLNVYDYKTEFIEFKQVNNWYNN